MAAPIAIQGLTAEAWAPFGRVLSAQGAGCDANAGTASRHDRLTELIGTRAEASWNVCVFRCTPPPTWPLVISALERHPHSTQVFSPMNGVAYLLVVAEGGQRLRPSTLRAFVAGPTQAIAYGPGTWHHPMIALGGVTDFLCLVHEDGGPGDCEVCEFEPVSLARPGYPPRVR